MHSIDKAVFADPEGLIRSSRSIDKRCLANTSTKEDKMRYVHKNIRIETDSKEEKIRFVLTTSDGKKELDAVKGTFSVTQVKVSSIHNDWKQKQYFWVIEQ